MKKNILSLLLISLLFSYASAAGIVYQQNMSADYLLNHANFPNANRQPFVSPGNAYLDFGNGITSWEKLIEIDLIPSGVLPTDAISNVFITMEAIPLTTDNDIAIAVSDGTDIVGFMRADNSGGTGWLAQGLDTSSPVVQSASLTNILGASSFPTVFSTDITLGATTEVRGIIGTDEFSVLSPRTIDRSEALSLIVFAGDATEQYRINSIDVTITTEGQLAAVPEPKSYALMLLGITSLIFLRKKSRNR